MEFEAGQISIANTPAEVAPARLGGSPSIDMPWRSETFITQGSEKVFQGRIYKNLGSHYWGSYVQGSS
jgi:hypothetical protein